MGLILDMDTQVELFYALYCLHNLIRLYNPTDQLFKDEEGKYVVAIKPENLPALD
jgi:hypothetical protein